MTEPTTAAVHCPRCGQDWSEVAVVRSAGRKAVAAALAGVRRRVGKMDPIRYRGISGEAFEFVARAAVLAILDEEAGR